MQDTSEQETNRMKCIADTNPNSHKDTGGAKNPAFPEHFPEPTEDELKIAANLIKAGNREIQKPH